MTVSRRDALIAAGTGVLATGLTVGSASTGAAAPAAIAAPATTVPPIDYPLRLEDMPLRDPYVVADKASGLYHLFVANNGAMSGTAGVGTMVYRSRDLKTWSIPQVVFRVSPELWGVNGGWAPEVHRWRGRWYLFVTLHNPAKPLPVPRANAAGIPVQVPQFQRGTVIAVSDSLLGPFTVVDPVRPVAPGTFMTLDGTLFKDRKGRPWMVYAHEWVQKIDGTIEAIPLKKDLSGADGKPIHLFKGSDATWISREMPAPSANQILPYVTDGPQLHRLPGGGLGMLWSTYAKNITNRNGMVTGHYVQTAAVSPSGDLHGPWIQQEPLVRRDSGHGMIFDTLPTTKKKSRPMLIVHRGSKVQHAKLYEIAITRAGFHLGKQRKDLDGGG